MSQLNFGIRIGATDASQPAFRSVLNGLTSLGRAAAKPITIAIHMAQSGMALARDFNLGLRPIVAAIDHVIERGARLDVVSKSFEAMTGGNSAKAAAMARYLRDMAQGTLRLSEAMEIANRGLAAGLNIEQLGTALAFVSAKAVATGKDARQAIDTVITGLSRGSTLFLDDFGILTDGIDGVKKSYQAIKGVGAWESLGPAAQKAETIRQALAEMKVALSGIGLSGKETIFVYSSIKNLLGDATDKLVATVARSKALGEALTGARDAIAGITEHFEKGGSFGGLLFGKGGSSGGLWGGLKAGLGDLFSGVWDGLKATWAWAVEMIPPAIIKGLKWLETDLLPSLHRWKNELIDGLSKAISDLMFGSNDQPNWFGRMMGADKSRAEEGFGLKMFDDVAAGFPATAAGLKTAGKSMLHGFKRAWSLLTGQGDIGVLGATTQPAPAGVGTGYGFGLAPGAIAAGAMGIMIRSGRKKWWDAFMEEFPAGPTPKAGELFTPTAPDMPADEVVLTKAGRRRRELQRNLLSREMARQSGLAAREAQRIAGEQERDLYGQGFKVTREGRQALERELYERILGGRTVETERRLGAVNAELGGISRPTVATAAEKAMERAAGEMANVAGAVRGLVKALGGEEGAISRGY